MSRAVTTEWTNKKGPRGANTMELNLEPWGLKTTFFSFLLFAFVSKDRNYLQAAFTSFLTLNGKSRLKRETIFLAFC